MATYGVYIVFRDGSRSPWKLTRTALVQHGASGAQCGLSVITENKEFHMLSNTGTWTGSMIHNTK